MTASLHPADAWVNCSCGGRHWGTYGAAGLLLSAAGARKSAWEHVGYPRRRDSSGGTDSARALRVGARGELDRAVSITVQLMARWALLSPPHAPAT